MSSNSDITIKKWNLIKEQLISLYVLNKPSKGNEDLVQILNEDVGLKCMNSEVLTSVCYFLLGIINSEERDKLIQWPLTNITTKTKFRKGLTAMVNSFQQKYPWANLVKLPESYFLNPHGHHDKVVDFIMMLSNLSIHIVLDDPELLLIHSGKGLNSREISIMTDIVTQARQQEDIIRKNNVFPVKEFEDVKNKICDKCVNLKAVNDDLEQQIANLIKHAVSNGVVPAKTENIKTEEIIGIKNEKLAELNKINEELLKYFNACKELLSKIKALKNPVKLNITHFGCENSLSDLIQTTYKVCDNLNQFHEYMICKSSSKEEEENFCELLRSAKKALLEEKEVLHTFLNKVTPFCQKE